MAKQSSDESPSFESKSSLKTGADRFLSQVVAHALDNNWRTPDDFLRHFTPIDLMQGLESAPELRKNILVTAAGVHEKIARKKSTQSAAEDLRLALDEGVTYPADILTLISPDDRVRYLARTKLFAFAFEDEFFAKSKAGPDHERFVERMVFLLDAAMAEQLVTLEDVVGAISFETVAQRLPLKELQKVVEHALTLGRGRSPLTAQSLLDVVSLRAVVGYVPLEHTWNRVIVAKVARPAGFVEGDGKEGKLETASKDVALDGLNKFSRPTLKDMPATKEPPPKPAGSLPNPANNGTAVSAPATSFAVNGKKTDEESSDFQEEEKVAPEEGSSAAEDEVDSLLEAADEVRPPAEEDARQRVLDRLMAISRLPPRHPSLSTPILLSIDSMYAELLSASTDEGREECIRESFPNEQHMTTALLALIELLDPSIDVNDPVIRDADLDSLIKVVLFEERHRYELAHPSQRPAGVTSGAAAAGRRTVPPPLPRSGSPMPPPLPGAEKGR